MFIVHVIDDDDAVRESLEALLGVAGFMIDTFASAEAYLEHLDGGSRNGDCVLLDLHMPGMNGLDLPQVLLVRQITLPVLVLTASHDVSVRDGAIGLGAVDCLTKPVQESVLLSAIESVRVSPR